MAETTPSRETLIELLGVMPERQPLQIDTLETVKLENGVRHKIKYFIEPGNPALDTPDDFLFEENEGRHSFPAGVKEQAYKWLDERLK